jgi:hypothetical protein
MATSPRVAKEQAMSDGMVQERESGKLRIRNIQAEGPWKSIIGGGFLAVAGAIHELAQAVDRLAEASGAETEEQG